MWAQGILTEYRIRLGSAIALVALAGLALGTALRRRFDIDKRRLEAIITVLLLATATAANLPREALPQLL